MRMMMIAGAVVAGVAAVGLAAAQDLPRQGYLGDAGPDTIAILPPAPAPGSPQAEADRAIFRASRSLKDSPRWAMAIADVDERRIVNGMSCAVGVKLDMASLPKTAKLMIHAAPDVIRAMERPKAFYHRKRPYQIDEGAICVVRDAELDASPDYPSGHATWGWTFGLILAEMAPDRAARVLTRARAFGESRMVCGVHSASAVDAGFTNASAVVAALHGSPAFRADLEAATAELAAVRQSAAPAEGCEAEAAVIATPVR